MQQVVFQKNINTIDVAQGNFENVIAANQYQAKLETLGTKDV